MLLRVEAGQDSLRKWLREHCFLSSAATARNVRVSRVGISRIGTDDCQSLPETPVLTLTPASNVHAKQISKYLELEESQANMPSNRAVRMGDIMPRCGVFLALSTKHGAISNN